jgi:hypothetical protein
VAWQAGDSLQQLVGLAKGPRAKALVWTSDFKYSAGAPFLGFKPPIQTLAALRKTRCSPGYHMIAGLLEAGLLEAGSACTRGTCMVEH